MRTNSDTDDALRQAATRADRSVREKSATTRNSVDVLIATFCIEHDCASLQRDRDFDAFDRLRGPRVRTS